MAKKGILLVEELGFKPTIAKKTGGNSNESSKKEENKKK